MSKRELTKIEKDLTQKNVKILKEDIKYILFQKEYHDLMISKGLRLNYERKLHEFHMRQKQLDEEFQKAEFSIVSAEDQIKNGVEEVKQDGRNN